MSMPDEKQPDNSLTLVGLLAGTSLLAILLPLLMAMTTMPPLWFLAAPLLAVLLLCLVALLPLLHRRVRKSFLLGAAGIQTALPIGCQVAVDRTISGDDRLSFIIIGPIVLVAALVGFGVLIKAILTD
jgi:uncharacterized membrane protein